MEIYKIILYKHTFTLEKPSEGIKENKKYFVVINHPLSHFIKSSITKRKIEGGYVVFGDLKPEFEELKGSGILSKFLTKTKDKVIDFFSPRYDRYNNTSKRNLDKYGNQKIVSIAIYRTPLPDLLNNIINIVSLGKWNELVKKYGFDKLFHLALVMTLDNNKNIIIEKNEVINISDSYKTKSNTETLTLDNYVSGTYTISLMLNKAQKMVNNDKLWFGYDPFNNNCQYFIKYILDANNLYSANAEEFLFQDVSSIEKELNSVSKGIMRGTTHLAGTINKFLGKGKPVNFDMEKKDSDSVHFIPIEKSEEYLKTKKELYDLLEKTHIPKITQDRGNLLGHNAWTTTFGCGNRRQLGFSEFNANKKHPELFDLLIKFGNLIVPKGYTYNAITLNKDMKANKHIDKQNEGYSIITGLGDFTGGELNVYKNDKPKPYNLKDKILIFNGSKLYHATNDFKGRRYTLIYYKQNKPCNVKNKIMIGI
jgi:hypothetical protein